MTPNAHYVLDTGFFIRSREYYPETFPSFWKKLGYLVLSEKISSVVEVKKELEKYGGEQEHLLEWIKQNKNIFTKPNEKEQNNVRKVFSTNNFRNLINKRRILDGKPFADPFVIAKVMIEESTVITTEKFAKKDKKGKIQGSPKIPDVCIYFGVRCLTPQEFMKEQNWKF